MYRTCKRRKAPAKGPAGARVENLPRRNCKASRPQYIAFCRAGQGANKPQVDISDVLHRGADNAVSARELSTIFKLPPRIITRAIERERRAGTPILANGRGYFLPGEAAEVDVYLTSLQQREGEIRKTRAAVAQARQQKMEFGEGDEP